ncbi:MAG: S-layer protein [bacterium F083]|nr:MAG: S-layer protein [bacterium F083]
MKKTFLMTLALLCAVAQGAWAQTEVGTEAALTEVINGDGSYKSVKMTADIQLGSHLVIENGKNVTLDLNGKKLSRSLADYVDDGNVVRVETGGQLTVKDSSGNDSGQITGGKAINGGGICNHGTLTIEGGTITGCSASTNGGAIYNAGTLNISGGAITYNKASSQGGGIWSKGTLTLSGGTVSHNEAPSTGGIDNTGTMTMSEGTVSNNKSTMWGGGGIANHHTMTISGGKITSNETVAEGGGIWNEGTLTMSNFIVNLNTARDAAGIWNEGTINMKGGNIVNNETSEAGAGGIANQSNATLNIDGCYVSGNTGKLDGCGIWSAGKLSMKGTITIWGNHDNNEKNNNLFLDGEAVIDVTGAITTGSKIGVSIAHPGRVFTKGYKSNNPSAAADAFFHSDKSKFSFLERDNELAITFYYNVRSWDAENKQVVTTPTPCPEYTVIEGSHSDDWIGLGDGYYVVSGNVTYKVLNILGSNVHLILPDNTTLNCNHVKLEVGHTLSIYSQSDGDKQGNLTVTNWLQTNNKEGAYRYAAAIGGGNDKDMGSLFIHGGNIEANCCNATDDDLYFNFGAGIGGGRNKGIGANDKLVVYGGNVTATGSHNGAGIGGGYGTDLSSGSGNQGGPVIIYGGNVTASSDCTGAGIGGGCDGEGGVVKIYGGKVTANSDGTGAGIGGGCDGEGGQVYIYGGETYAIGGNRAAGIGGAWNKRGNTFEMHGGYLFAAGYGKNKVASSSPAIGGGFWGHGDAAYIYGGTICAVKYDTPSALIGGGYDEDNGDLIVNEGLKVSWGTQADALNDTKYQTLRTGEELGLTLVESAAERQAAIQNRSYTCVLIEPCNHQGTGSTYTYADEDYHNVTCKTCGYTGKEAHTYDGDNPCACGKPHNATADLWTVMLHRATGAASTSYADRVPMMVVKGQPLTVPAVSGTQGLQLLGYVEAADAPTGIMLLETEKSSLIKVGDELTPSADMDLYARYGYVFNTAWTWAADASSASVTLSHDALSPVTLSSTDGKVTITPRVLTDDAGNVIGKRYVATCTYTLNGYEYTFTNNYQHQDISIMDDDDNSEAIDYYEDTIVNATLTDRTLYKDGSWNTLYLPFSLSTLNGTPLEGATVKTLRSSSFDSSTGTLTLNFSEALTRIEAGTPYIIKWDKADDYVDDDEHNIVNPVFTDVTISYVVTISDAQSETPESACAEFVGSFSPVNLKANDRSVLYLGADNKLYYPSSDMTVGSCRALFQLNGITAGDLSTQARAFVLNFGEDEATGVREVKEVREVKDNSWYTLDGRRLTGKPTTKGLYINNGRKVVIK